MPPPIGGDTTDPKIRLDDVSVTVKDCLDCQDRTAKKLDRITDTLNRIEGKIDSHLSYHDGMAAGTGRATVSIRTIGTIVGIVTALGGALWALARTLP